MSGRLNHLWLRRTWAWLAAYAVLLGVTGGSLVFEYGWVGRGSGLMAGVVDARVVVGYLDLKDQSAFIVETGWRVGRWDGRGWSLRMHGRVKGRRAVLPLWVPLVVAGVMAARCGYGAYARAGLRECDRCGYDLAGLGRGGKCPECGVRSAGDGA